MYSRTCNRTFHRVEEINELEIRNSTPSLPLHRRDNTEPKLQSPSPRPRPLHRRDNKDDINLYTRVQVVSTYFYQKGLGPTKPATRQIVLSLRDLEDKNTLAHYLTKLIHGLSEEECLSALAATTPYAPEDFRVDNGRIIPYGPGDWKCGSEGCGFHNFAKDITCLRCGAFFYGAAVVADASFSRHSNSYANVSQTTDESMQRLRDLERRLKFEHQVRMRERSEAVDPVLEKEKPGMEDQRANTFTSKADSSTLTRRLSRTVVVGLPRSTTFKRQNSELRDRLVPEESENHSFLYNQPSRARRQLLARLQLPKRS
jgi:Zn-finger in Ran binding protein and others